MMRRFNCLPCTVLLAAVLALPALFLSQPAAAEPIQGVQPAALDQPRIFLNVRRHPAAEPLEAEVWGQRSATVEAFLDTGASGIVFSRNTASALGLRPLRTAEGRPVRFEDVGVAGKERFNLSEPLFLSFAEYSSRTDGSDPSAYAHPIGPVHIKLRPQAGLLDLFTGGLDVVGMPAMLGRVVVIDARPVHQFDKLRTSIHAPGDPEIPATDRHIPLTYVSFARFTTLDPPDAAPPAFTVNPMIGPDPFRPDDPRLPVLLRHGGQTVRTSMLLDTAAVASMISRAHAESLGVRYAANGSRLEGVPEEDQFSLMIGGIGGQKTVLGFFMDQLVLPEVHGRHIVYARAPVLVFDIEVTDDRTGERYTLDALLGMNFLVASAYISGGLMPDIGEIREGAFQHIVIDNTRGIMGLKMR